MSAAPELNFQNFNPIQGPTQPKPVTLAAAATITPTTALTFVTGTIQVANVTPPVPEAYCSIKLCFTNGAPGAFLTNGTAYPLKTAYQPIQNRPITINWDPVSKYWWVDAVV